MIIVTRSEFELFSIASKSNNDISLFYMATTLIQYQFKAGRGDKLFCTMRDYTGAFQETYMGQWNNPTEELCAI